MQNILFRAKRKDNGEWIEGYFVMVDPVDTPARIRKLKAVIFPKEAKCNWFNKYFYNAVEVIPETVGQSFEVFDKHGRKIFEGDIVKGSILYDMGSYPHEETIITAVSYDKSYPGIFNTVEVIGNIYDNPELVKEK